nr:hypothetical protein [Tanacetum cinerariifolium]
MKPENPTDADLLGTGAKYQEDQTQSSRLRYQSLTGNEGKPSYEGEPDTQPMLLTYVDVRAILLSEDGLRKVRKTFWELVKKWMSIINLLKPNIKASIDDYYYENIAHRDQTDKLVEPP